MKKLPKDVLKDEDTILTIGEEGKKGDRAFKDFVKEEEKESKVKRDGVLNLIDGNKDKLEYNRFLSELLKGRIMSTAELKSGWIINTAPTKIGVVLELKSPIGRIFRSAFMSTREPLLDLTAIENFAVRADITMEGHSYDIKDSN